MELFDLKANLNTVGTQLASVEKEIMNKAADPNASIDEVRSLKQKRDDLKERMDILQNQHDTLEREQKAKIQASLEKAKAGASAGLNSEDPKVKKISAKAGLIRATMRKEVPAPEVRAALGDNNGTGGEKLLPKTVSEELIHEPFVKNPLRELSTYTSVTNLEIPKVDFSLDDDDFIQDLQTAKELEVDGDVVTFGRRKFKVMAKISETILAATDTDLVATVERALQSGLAAKEKKVSFAVTPKQGEEEMSFYAAGIKQVTAEDKYKAIKKAIADLPEDFRENAKVMMTYADYLEIIETLANGSATLYGAQPEQIIGKPVEFCDAAVDPIVGDFRYSHFNYDPAITYESDKDVKTGENVFVLTAYFDHKIKLKSAFRIAKVDTTP
ncbi:phage major capsid protein [Bacillus paralicheniformis]|jgi:HK97 family phage major capsid protein|uniref:Phage related protein n=2 Tax=Bacillus licheniformis TaxID=1402 RepID=Q65KG3_BACLD|nr:MULTISPECIES: phage major capsid protein [Bacillus]AAU23096.1 phage related protein [Bacillus licheniformis DSM 13 = ATCC 14580]AAU40451.1 phage putative capsid protein [Bacillus licheniformis DSM 13 = ATCC 14580]AUZ30271.1 phage major capsid protein [Bacillus licheniformis]KAA0807339.1 phage major capsid protein [Bacillus licheniformis]KAA0819696.1 phage major capsid protein [Bacillus licheniformis]